MALPLDASFVILDQEPHTEGQRAAVMTINPLDVRRKAQIGKGGPTDHHGEVVLAKYDVDLNKTIFVTISGFLARSVVSSRLGVLPHWPDPVVHRYEELYDKIPKAPSHDQAIVEFLLNDADLSVEHADGSFMDHLQWGYEYSHAHFKDVSPRILLLHSVMGVGTNYFPIKEDQIPKFQSLLTEDEFKHVEAFPSILRLLGAGPLMDELLACDQARLDNIAGISFSRVMGNKALSLNKDEFWTHLNIHMIHTLDFLPAEDWTREVGDNFLFQIRHLHAILTRADKLKCKLDMNLKPAFPNSTTQGRQTGISLGTIIRDCVPSGVQIKLARNQITKFSQAINHSLDYELKFSA